MLTHSGTALLNPVKIFDSINLHAGMRVADLGCGRTGHLVFPASKIIGDTGIVYALDIQKEIVEELKSRIRSGGLHNIEMVWSDLENASSLRIAPSSLDACWLVSVIHQIKDRFGVLKNAAALLRPEGFLAVVDWSKKLGAFGPEENKMVLPEVLVENAEKLGLTNYAQFPINDYQYCIIFKKGKSL